MQKKSWVGVRGVESSGGQDGCERRSESIVKMQLKKVGGGLGMGWVRVGGGQGEYERRIDVFVKMQKNEWGGRVWGSVWM